MQECFWKGQPGWLNPGQLLNKKQYFLNFYSIVIYLTKIFRKNQAGLKCVNLFYQAACSAEEIKHCRFGQVYIVAFDRHALNNHHTAVFC